MHSLPPTSGELWLVPVLTSNQISPLAQPRWQIAGVSLLTTELKKSDNKRKENKIRSQTFQRLRNSDSHTISRCKNISCSSRFGFNPSTFFSRLSSASKNWGFEIINGADTQGYLVDAKGERKSISNYNEGGKGKN